MKTLMKQTMDEVWVSGCKVAMKSMMRDKRSYKRFTLNDLEVNGKMISATETKVVDISISGISLKVNRRINIGCEYPLTLKGRKTISLRGIVVWCSLIETKKGSLGEIIPIYSAGMQFKNMSTEMKTELLNFIEDYKIKEVHVIGDNRLNVRFHINDPEKAILNFSASYKVKTISLGGMLIESVQDLEVESRIPMELFIHDDALVKFVGRVASCRVVDKEGQKSYDIGIEFLDLTKKDVEIISSFIDYSTAHYVETGNKPEITAGKYADEAIPAISKDFTDKVEYLYKWHKTMGYYKVLDIREYATNEQIKQAFLKKIHELHPDKFPGASDDLKQKLNELSTYLNVARTTLLDSEKRKGYDRMPNTRVKL